MRTKQTNVFTFDELNDDAKEKARDWYRSRDHYDNYWAESVTDSAKEIGKLFGFTIDDIYWSGFSSQGDGACFVGSWNPSLADFAKWRKDGWEDKELHRIADVLESIAKDFPNASCHIKHTGHYYHSHSVSIDCDLMADDYYDTDDPIQEAAFKVREALADKTDDDLIEACRDFMDWIYASLEKEWDYINADEQVDESLRANEYEFSEDGTMA